MSDRPLQVILYSTSACHLCELAAGFLQPFVEAGVCRVQTRDISDSEALIERYGVRIPVLRLGNGRELDWPFDTAQLAAFLAG
jgi:hypothetical protein